MYLYYNVGENNAALIAVIVICVVLFVVFIGVLVSHACTCHLPALGDLIIIITRGQRNLTKSASRGARSPVRGHPRWSKVVPLNSWGRVSY